MQQPSASHTPLSGQTQDLLSRLELSLNKKEPSRRDEVYAHLLSQMNDGRMLPGSIINMNSLCEELSISRTPLRDALIRLDAEGIVTIRPRSHIAVNSLTVEEFEHLYDLIGAIEAALIRNSFAKYDPRVLDAMKFLNREMEEALHGDDIRRFEHFHYRFHHVFPLLSGNTHAKRVLAPMKNRIWDFPKRSFFKDWFWASVTEHWTIISLIEQGKREEVTSFMRERHWGFAFNRDSIRKTYFS